MAGSGDMSEPPWKPIVDAVRGYYSFLANDLGAIPSGCIAEPPEAGWPNITQDALAGLEKTDAVVELLRHLPYIEPSADYNTHVAFATDAVDYRAVAEYKVAPGTRRRFIPIGNEDFPAHVVVLTVESGDDHYGSLLLLDTKTGLAYDHQPQAPRGANVPDPETTTEIWRYDESAPIGELLAAWEQKFRSLEWTANPFDNESGLMLRHDNATDEVRQIYREHGWPESFRREECLAALQAWNSTIGERLAEPGNNLHEINRQPPGLHDNQGRSSDDDYDEEGDE